MQSMKLFAACRGSSDCQRGIGRRRSCTEWLGKSRWSLLFHTGWQVLAGKDNKRFLAGEPGLDRDGALFVAS